MTPGAKSFFGGIGLGAKKIHTKANLLEVPNIVDAESVAFQLRDAASAGVLNKGYLKSFNFSSIFGKNGTKYFDTYINKMIELGKAGDLTGEEIQAAFQSVRDEQDKVLSQNSGLGKSFKNLGQTILSALGNMAIMAAISFLITSAIQLYEAWKNVNDEMLKTASDLGKEFSNSKKEIEDYKTEIDKLQQTLNDNNTSQDEAIAARQRLLEIQDQLIAKYGDETEAINNISKAIIGEVDSLDYLSDKKWQETINAFNNPEDEDWAKKLANSWWRTSNGKAETNFEALVNAMEAKEVASFSGLLPKELQEYLKTLEYVQMAQQTVREANGDFIDIDTIKITGDNLQDIYDHILEIQTLTNGFDEKFTEQLTAKAKDIKQTLSDGAEIYNQYVIHDYIMGTKYEGIWQKVQKQYEAYNKAFVDGNEELAEENRKQLLDTYTELFAGLSDSTADTAIKNFFEKLFPAITAEFKKTKIDVDFNPNVSGKFASEYQNKVLSAINQFSSIEDVLHFNSENATEGQKEAYNILIAAAENYGMAVDELIEKLKELFGLDISTRSEEVKNSIADRYSEATGKNLLVRDSLNVGLDKLSAEDYNQVKTFTDSDWQAVEEHLQKINEEQGDGYSSASDWAQAMHEVAEETRQVADNGADIPKWSNQTFSEQVNELDALQTAYTNFRKNVEDKAPKINLDISEVDALREKFGELEGFEEFEITVTSDTSSVDEINNAFDKMLTQYANTKIDLKALSDETKEMVRTQLEMEGATAESAKAFVDYHNEVAKGIKLHEEVKNMTVAETQAYLAEAEASDIARASMFEAAVAEQVFGGVELSVADKIAKIKELASAFLGEAQAATIAARATSLQSLYENHNISDVALQHELNKLTDITIEPTVKWDKTISGAKDAGSKAGEEFKNAFEKKLEGMNAAISAIGTLFSSKISAANSAKDAAISSLNEEKEAAISAIKAEQKAKVDAINAEIKAIDKQIKAYQEQQEALQKQIKAIEDANAARTRALNLQKAIYELNRSENQRSKLVA